MPIVNPAIVSISDNYVVEVRIITAGEESAKQLVLTEVPTDPEKVTLDLIGGTSQQKNLDFDVLGSILTWNGFALETVIEEGDKLRIIYPL